MGKTSQEIFEELKQWGCAVEEAKERLLNNDDLYLQFLHKVATDKEYLKLQPLLNQKEYQAAFELAHGQRGVAANLSLTPLYQALSQLVEKLRAGNDTDYYEACSKIDAGYEMLRQIMAE